MIGARVLSFYNFPEGLRPPGPSRGFRPRGQGGRNLRGGPWFSWAPPTVPLGPENYWSRSVNYLCLLFFLDIFKWKNHFFKFLLPTWTPRSLKIIVFPKEKHCFFEKRPLEVNSDFGSIWEANMPPKSSQNLPKSGKYRLSRPI